MARPDLPDVLVLGAGLIGLACARLLAHQGFKVRVLERSEPGAEASAAAAGMLAPLAEVPEPGPMFDACFAARDLWWSFIRELEEESGLSVALDAEGTLVPSLGEEDDAFLDRLETAARSLGERAERQHSTFFRALVPAIAPQVRGGLLLPDEMRVDNRQVTQAVLAAGQLVGVDVVTGRTVERVAITTEGVEVTGVSDEHRDADPWREAAPICVLALGAWSGTVEIVGDDGEPLPALPVRPVRGQMLALGGVDWPWTGTLRGRSHYAVRRPARSRRKKGAGGLLVGATVEDAGFAAHPTAEGLADLTAWVRRVIPGAAKAPVERVWAGLRPGTPDELPSIGPYPAGGPPRLVVATGHYRNGILLAPWTAEHVADLVSTGETPETLRPFLPGRF